MMRGGKKAVLIYTNSNSPPSATVWWVRASQYILHYHCTPLCKIQE